MKENFLILILIQFSLFAQAQTLKETQDWLKNKIESFGKVLLIENDSDLVEIISIKTKEFNFINNQISIKERKIRGWNEDDITSLNEDIYTKINLTDIRSIRVYDKGIIIKTGSNKISSQSKFSERIAADEKKMKRLLKFKDETRQESEHYIFVDFSKEEDLSYLMVKATKRFLAYIQKHKGDSLSVLK